MPRNYEFYTQAQKRFLIRFANRMDYVPGHRIEDGGWDDLSSEFYEKFEREVDSGILSFQARQLWKAEQVEKDGVPYPKRVRKKSRARQ